MKENNPFLYALKYFFAAIIAVALIIALGLSFNEYLRNKKETEKPSPVGLNKDRTCIVIDAGHGGEDGGAVAADGTLEKDLNLPIARVLATLFELNGNQVRLTRSDDKLLYDHYNELDDYSGTMKLYDLKNRLRITNEYSNPIYIGIHMNKFPQEKYSGLQVYYSPNDEKSPLIANSIQGYTKNYLQKNNNRQTKKANSSIFILNNIETPAVLVECGFISNVAERDLLKTPEYRLKLALTVFASVLSFCND